MHIENDPYAITWRDQLIELDLPGVGPITASADPALFIGAMPPAPTEDPTGWGETGWGETDWGDATGGDGAAYRRRQPTTPPERDTVQAMLQGRVPLELQHTWLVLPALGPVLPTMRPEGITLADLSGREAPYEIREESREVGPEGSANSATSETPSAPSREGVWAGAPIDGRQPPRRPPVASWFRRPVVAGALRERGGPVALGALVGPRRDWFEPAAAAREDLLASHPDQALESALVIAVDQGQPAVLRIGPGGLDVIPTGSDPRVPELEGLELLVTGRPVQCPLQGCDGAGPCRPHGGPWIRAAHAAQVDWEARRSQALAVQDCGVCFGEALPPELDQPPMPRLSRRASVTEISRLHLRSGEVVRIDPIAPQR